MAFKPSYFVADLFKVLSSPVRIQILDVLRLGEASSNYIAQWIEVETASVTKHLLILRSHNLIKVRREGTCIYSVRDPAIFKMLDAALEVLNNRRAEVKDTPEQP
jgi:ArsR family transcriptional regulator